MDVDHPSRVGSTQPVGHDLHEPREHYQFNRLFLENRLNLTKTGLPVPVDPDMVKGKSGLLSDGAAVLPVADDGGDFHRHFSEARTPENLIETVIRSSDQDRCPHPVGKAPEVPSGTKGASQRTKTGDEIIRLHVEAGGLYFKAGEKAFVRRVGELVKLDQVTLVIRDITRNPRHETRAVGTVNLQNQTFTSHGIICAC